MDTMIEKLANLGGIGVLAGALLWMVFSAQKKLFSVIENNTKALTELTSIIRQHFNGR